MTKKGFEDFLGDIEERYGNIIAKKEIRSISTGSFSLDASTGIGGIGLGRVSIYYGVPGSGKTTLCLETSKNAILNGFNVLYVDAENMLDLDYAEHILGIPVSDNEGKFVVLQPDTAEDVLNIIGKGIESGKFNLIILDSVGALSPKKEKDEKDFEKQDVALVSRLFSKFLRIYFHSIQTNGIALLIVDQVRANIGAYVQSYTMPGGYALAHASSLSILFTKGQDIKQGDEIVGTSIKFNIKKNKSGKPFKSYTFPLMFGEGVDYLRDLVFFCKEVGVLQQAGAYYRFEGINLGRGIIETMEYFRENPEALDKVKQVCYNIVNKIKVEEGEEELDETETIS